MAGVQVGLSWHGAQERALLVINHVSYLDALVMGEAFMPCGLAKVRPAHLPLAAAALTRVWLG